MSLLCFRISHGSQFHLKLFLTLACIIWPPFFLWLYLILFLILLFPSLTPLQPLWSPFSSLSLQGILSSRGLYPSSLCLEYFFSAIFALLLPLDLCLYVILTVWSSITTLFKSMVCLKAMICLFIYLDL